MLDIKKNSLKESSSSDLHLCFNKSFYDYHNDLTFEEKTALNELQKRWKKNNQGGPWSKKHQKALHQLVAPLKDALQKTEASRTLSRIAILIIFREMAMRQTPFWKWHESEWIEIIGIDNEAFKRRYNKPRGHRQIIKVVAYLFGGITDLHACGNFFQVLFAHKVFDKNIVDESIRLVLDEVLSWGYGRAGAADSIPALVAEALIANRSPHLHDLNITILRKLYTGRMSPRLKRYVSLFSKVLVRFGILTETIQPLIGENPAWKESILTEVPPVWLDWCKRWREASTLSKVTNTGKYYILLSVGRWLKQNKPSIVSPEHWTRNTAIDYVSAVVQMKIGDYSCNGRLFPNRIGQPLTPTTKDSYISTIRSFFRDCQEWDWIPRIFDPNRVFATPRTIKALIAPKPRIVADDVWAKLLWAGLNVSDEDLMPDSWEERPQFSKRYPTEMLRAIILVWLFSGLRSDELSRLRVGCISWQSVVENESTNKENKTNPTVCFLTVPTGKTATEFIKPVDGVVGQAIETWEQVRPKQPMLPDEKTGGMVHYLFSYRHRRVGNKYINDVIIPILCRKAGIPESDAKGRITSHRARSTIATQLYNAKEPMSLLDLQQWLGHRSLRSTVYYAEIMPTKLAKAYQDAGYFSRNVRVIEVLIDQQAIKTGVAMEAPWKYYDLGHGYCTYDFFDQCPHRMACAKCSFYISKESSQAQLIEAKTNLQRLLQEIPLNDAEKAAVEDGMEAVQHLIQSLKDVPTPDSTGLSKRRSLPILPD